MQFKQELAIRQIFELETVKLLAEKIHKQGALSASKIALSK
jgi:hypothetical protein